MARPRALRLFNRYQQYGGEERSFQVIGEALTALCDVTDVVTSTAELLNRPLWRKPAIAVDLFHNSAVIRRIDALHAEQRFDFWQVHNAFPGMSPAIYRRAFEHGVPVIHYLHNYRFGCVNSFFFRNGETCYRCMGGNFWPAVVGASWHDSRLASGLMGAVLAHARRMGVFEKVAR